MTFTVRSPLSSIETTQSTVLAFVCVHEYPLVAALLPVINTSEAFIQISSVTWIVVSVILALDSFVGAIICMTGRFSSITYDCELYHVAPILASSPLTCIVPVSLILLITHVTGAV